MVEDSLLPFRTFKKESFSIIEKTITGILLSLAREIADASRTFKFFVRNIKFL